MSINGSIPAAAMRSFTSSWRASVERNATWLTHTGRPFPVEISLFQSGCSPTPCTSKNARQLPSPASKKKWRRKPPDLGSLLTSVCSSGIPMSSS